MICSEMSQTNVTAFLLLLVHTVLLIGRNVPVASFPVAGSDGGAGRRGRYYRQLFDGRRLGAIVHGPRVSIHVRMDHALTPRRRPCVMQNHVLLWVRHARKQPKLPTRVTRVRSAHGPCIIVRVWLLCNVPE